MISIRESGELYTYCLVYLLNNNMFLEILSVNSSTILPGISGHYVLIILMLPIKGKATTTFFTIENVLKTCAKKQ